MYLRDSHKLRISWKIFIGLELYLLALINNKTSKQTIRICFNNRRIKHWWCSEWLESATKLNAILAPLMVEAPLCSNCATVPSKFNDCYQYPSHHTLGRDPGLKQYFYQVCDKITFKRFLFLCDVYCTIYILKEKSHFGTNQNQYLVM